MYLTSLENGSKKGNSGARTAGKEKRDLAVRVAEHVVALAVEGVVRHGRRRPVPLQPHLLKTRTGQTLPVGNKGG